MGVRMKIARDPSGRGTIERTDQLRLQEISRKTVKRLGRRFPSRRNLEYRVCEKRVGCSGRSRQSSQECGIEGR